MKLSTTYVPHADGNLAVWAATYKEKMGLLGGTLGIASEEIAEQQQLAQAIIDNINKVDVKKVELKEAVSLKDLVKQKSLQEIRNMVSRIKTFRTYTPNMGEELGIVTTGHLIDFSTLRPVLSVTSYPGYVSIAFNKQRMFGVRLYSRVKGEQQWNLLGMAKASPFYDEAPLSEEGKPEIREYKAICFNGLEEIGQYGDVASLAYGG